ncbi:MAG: cell division protein SepF [Eggerthellaceae bacterium]
MDFPRPSVSPSNLIGDLKDRFGFGGGNNRRQYDDDPYYDEYDEYAPDEGYYDDAPAYQANTQADPYDRLEYTTRSAPGQGSSRRSSQITSPRLVSTDDIRATTSAYGVSDAVASSSSYAAGSSYSSSVGSSALRTTSSSIDAGASTEQFDVPATSYGDFVSPYQSHARQSTSTVSHSSQGFDSLFTPSTSDSSATVGAASVATSSIEAASASSATPASTSREVVLLQPLTYEDVATVARSVRKGDIVVLSLRSTDAALSKRVLDFSFGVASALDARVDCVADKTFVILQGADLSLEERHRLQKQGIL